MFVQSIKSFAEVSMVQSCIDSAFRLFHPSPEKPESFGDDKLQQSRPEPIDVLVDTIIGCLERGTAFMRAVGNRSFSLISGVVKDSTVDLILSVSVSEKEASSNFNIIHSSWNVGTLGNFSLTRAKKAIPVRMGIRKTAAVMICPLLRLRTVKVRQKMRD
jgi:hypothetical protein